MAPDTRQGARDLTIFDRLIAEPETFHIFHALRVIEARFAEGPLMGQSRSPAQDAVRLGQEAELAFPPSSIRSFAPPGSGPGKMVNRFFGLFGPHGALPTHLTEYAHERLVNFRDPTFIAFADMLTHRLMGLFYRAWVTGQPAASFDRGEDGMIERKVAAIGGFAGRHMRGRDAMPDLAKRHFAAHLGGGPRTPDGLTSMLSAFLAVPVRLQEFVGSWLDLQPDDRWQLGSAAGLGQATSIGNRVWSRAAKVRLVLGPMGLPDFNRLLPGGQAMARLRAIVRSYLGDALDWDVNLILRADEIPAAVLGGNAALGHRGWIGQRPPGRDADDLIVAPPPPSIRNSSEFSRQAPDPAPLGGRP